MKYEVVDFRKPGRVSEDIGQMLSQWQHRIREAFEIRWGQCVACGVKVRPTQPAPLTGNELRDLDSSSITYRIDITETGHATLLVIQRSLALGLVKEMLGDAAEELPEDRPLTAIETTCVDFLIDELRGVIQAGQKLDPPRKLKNRGRAQLKELHAEFPENVTNTDVAFEIELPYGTETVRWVLPQDVTLDFVANSEIEGTSNGKASEELERLVLGAPCDLIIQLGQGQVSLSKLTSLKPGDIIKLDQRVDDKFVAVFGGQRLFEGWSGRIGKQQAFQIDEVLDSPIDHEPAA